MGDGEEKKPKKLTPKQKKFAAEYLKDGNGTRAAKAAGYSKKSAKQIASKNMTKHDLSEEIEKNMGEIHREICLNAKWVLTRLMTVVERSLQEIPVMEYDKIHKEYFQKCDEETGKGIWEFDSSGANRALEILAKHLKLLNEKTEISINMKLDEKYKRACANIGEEAD